MDAQQDRLRRLRASRATGHVPPDLVPWLVELATAATPAAQPVVSPAERLKLQVGDEVDRWMARRGVTHRTFSASRRTLGRCLKGGNISLSSLADLADALDCDATVRLKPRGAHVAPSAPQLAPVVDRPDGPAAR